jgi:hypothetical protein
MNKYMLQASFVMLTVATGQLFGAASSEDSTMGGRIERRIDTFDSEVHELPAAVQSLPIVYLRNSKFDRLRVTLPVFGAPVCTSEAPMVERGLFTYVAQTAPIAVSPLQVATIGQILNANPFKRESLPTDKKWLHLCVSGDGIADLVLDQSNEPVDPSAPCSSLDPVVTASQSSFKVDETTASDLLKAYCRNKRNLEQASGYLQSPEGYSQNIQLGVLFGEIQPRRRGDAHALEAQRLVANKVAAIQGWTSLCTLQ